MEDYRTVRAFRGTDLQYQEAVEQGSLGNGDADMTFGATDLSRSIVDTLHNSGRTPVGGRRILTSTIVASPRDSQLKALIAWAVSNELPGTPKSSWPGQTSAVFQGAVRNVQTSVLQC